MKSIISLCTVALYQFVERTYTVRENVSSLMVTVELAPSSGILLNNITLTISSVGGSATGLVLIIYVVNINTFGKHLCTKDNGACTYVYTHN